MSEPIVIDQETQTIVDAPVGTPIGVQVYVAGENVPAVRSSTSLRSAQGAKRGLAIESAEDVHEQERLAQTAAAAVAEWNNEAAAARRIGVALGLDRVHGHVDRILAGLRAWVLLDVDRPSRRTLEEYTSNTRDWLIYIASSGIAPGEVGQEDAKAFKVFLQSAGAVDAMEQLRADWFARPARSLYRMDRRDVVMWSIGWLANRARSKAARAGMLSALQAVASTFETAPRQSYRDTYSADTAALKLVCVRWFYTSAMARGALYANPITGIKVGKGKTSRENRIRSRMFSWDEVRALIESCNEDAVNGPIEKARQARDRAILACGAVLGMRISDVVNLDLGDYRPEVGESGAFFIRAGKGDKDRVVDLTDKMRSVIERWLTYRDLTKSTSAAMFISLHRGGGQDKRKPFDRMDERSVRMMFDARQLALGIKREGRSFHGLRHRFATRALDKGGNLFRISEQLGHASITTTQIYVHVNAMEQENPSKLTDDVL